MKLKNLYLVSIALLAGMFAACSDDTENFDNRVYISSFFNKPFCQGQHCIAEDRNSGRSIPIGFG